MTLSEIMQLPEPERSVQLKACRPAREERENYLWGKWGDLMQRLAD